MRLEKIISTFDWINLIELFIIAFIIIAVYFRFIRRSSSRKIFNGVVIIFLAYLFAKILDIFRLSLLSQFLEGITTVLLFSVVVIFQPELRRFFGYLGQPGFIQKALFSAPQKEENYNQVDFIKELSDAIKYLSKSKIGALMVFQNDENMSAYSEIGTKIYSAISSELILTVFHPNTALHDGAMVITKDKIIAAGVLLPLTDDPELSWQYGTRHRAAIGITEVSNVTCIVVSEETGSVSFTKGGKLTKIENAEMLSEELKKLVNPTEQHKKYRFFGLHKSKIETSENEN